MTYPEALDIARSLTTANTNAARLLRKQCRLSKRQPTFVIMRYGDPRQWRGLPKASDPRSRKRTIKAPAKVWGQRPTKDWRKIVNGRAVRLQHIDSATPVEYATIVEFCARHLPGKSDPYHVTPVLNGERPSFKGWYLPETLVREVQMRDVYGNLVSFKVRDAKQYGLTPRTVCSMLRGKRDGAKQGRIALADTVPARGLLPISKRPKITSVTLVKGKRVVTASSLPKVAIKAGIQTSIASVYAMAYGLRDEVRGFRLKAIKTEPRRVFSVP